MLPLVCDFVLLFNMGRYRHDHGAVTATRTSAWRLLAAYLVFGALALSPLLWTAVPPLIDFPNHLARMSVLANRDPAAAVTANYVVHWRLLPNLAMDLIVPI